MDTFFLESRVDARKASLLPNALLVLDVEHIQEITIDKIYYVTRGRNAWHSFWAKTYFDGCFQSSFQTATDIAESLRTQGSKFYVTELPTLTVACKGMAISVLEINTTNPLATFSATPVRGASLARLGLPSSQNVSLFGESATTGDFLRAILARGLHWRQEPSTRSSVFVHVYRTNRREYKKLGNRKLRAWRSESHGKGFYLGWDEVSSNISAGGMRHLIASS